MGEPKRETPVKKGLDLDQRGLSRKRENAAAAMVVALKVVSACLSCCCVAMGLGTVGVCGCGQEA